MKVKLVLLVFVIVYISLDVDGKAVKNRIKRIVYPGSTQWIDPQQKESENMHGYRYPVDKIADHSYGSNRKVDDYAEKSDPNPHTNANYDLESYENLEKMLDSVFVHLDLQTSQQETSKEKLTSNSQKWKGIDNPLENDQVFLHYEKVKPSKSLHSSHKVKQNIPDGHLNVHSKGKEKSKTSISMIHPEISTDSKNQQSTMSGKQLHATSQQFEFESPSGKLTFGSIPSDVIHDLSEIFELNQTNIAENESDVLNLSESNDLEDEDIGKLISNFESRMMKKNQPSAKGNFAPVNAEDKNLFRMGINQVFETKFDSFIFNPSAEPFEKFQECQTPRNESGSCKYVQHCMLISFLDSVQHFMENVCIIEGRFIGVCCPEFPVQSVSIKWKDQAENFMDVNNSVEIPQDCGIGTNTRIVGGNNADRKAWPWMVALLNNKNKFYCGGTLINNQYVLTAAHCTFGSPQNEIIARLGEYDFTNPREPHDDYKVVEIKRHGQYNGIRLRNDIALLKLEKPVVFNEFVKTICFPGAIQDYVGKVSTLVGWGHLKGGSAVSSDVLQEASFPVISNDQCRKTHGLDIPSSLICAASSSQDSGACNGDSGGPLMLLDENGRWKVIGVVSWGRRGCNPKFPTVYTRVTHYMDWIKKHST